MKQKLNGLKGVVIRNYGFLFVGTLFDYSRAWGFTSSNSILFFIDSLSFCT